MHTYMHTRTTTARRRDATATARIDLVIDRDREDRQVPSELYGLGRGTEWGGWVGSHTRGLG